MEFFDVVKARHSVRLYSDRPVPDESVRRILETANRAPSAGNLQAYEIYVIQKQEHRNALSRAANGQEFLSQAPLVLVFCTHAQRSEERYGRRGVSLYRTQDATIACTFSMLAAAAIGLGTVWVGAFDEDAVREVVAAPTGIIPIALLPIGFSVEEPPERPRRPLGELVKIL